MDYTIIIVGKSLILNRALMSYLSTVLKDFIIDSSSIEILEKSESNLFLKLEDAIEKSQRVIIISHYKSFNFINKVLATLSDDKLELIEDMLIPSKSIKYQKNSFLILKDEKEINSISIQEGEEIPPVLFETSDSNFTFSMIGIDDDSLKILLEPLASTYEIKISTTAVIEGYNTIRATATKYGDLENFLKSVKSLFMDKFVPNENIVEHISNSLIEYNKKISVAESCTGGLIASMLTKNPGVSSVFDGSVISYSNDIKRSWLGVSKETLENFGAVSEECLREMLDGVMSASDSDFALATSGIAGPSGGTKEKPVGTVFVGAKSKDGKYIIERLLLKGDREYIQTQSAYYAFKLLMLIDKSCFL